MKDNFQYSFLVKGNKTSNSVSDEDVMDLELWLANILSEYKLPSDKDELKLWWQKRFQDFDFSVNDELLTEFSTEEHSGELRNNIYQDLIRMRIKGKDFLGFQDVFFDRHDKFKFLFESKAREK